MAAKQVRAGGAFVEFSLRRKGLEKALRQVGQRIRQFGGQIRQIGASLSAIGGAITAPFVASIAIFAKVGDSLDKMSQRTGIGVEALSELGFAAEQNGSSLGTVEKAVAKMSLSLGDLRDDLTTQARLFEGLEITYAEIEKLSPEDQFIKLGDAISKIENPTKRSEAAQRLFARAGKELVPLLSQGADGIAKFREEARALGIVIDDETAKGAAEFTDALNVLKLQLKAGAVAVGSALAPALTKAAKTFSVIGKAIIDFVKENKALIVTVASIGAALLALGGTLVALGTAIGLAGFALTSLVGLLAALTSPIGLVIAGVVALGVALVTFTDTGKQAIDFLRDRFGSLLEFAQDTFKGIGKALEGQDLQLAAKILWASLQLIFLEGSEGIANSVIKLKADVLTAITEITIGSIAEGSKLYAGLQELWTNISSSARTLWTNVKGDTKEAFNFLVLQAEKAGIAVRGALNEGFDTEKANENAEARFVNKQKKTQEERDGALTKIQEERDARIKAIEDEASARKTAIQEALRDELAAINAGREEEAAKLKDKIAGLKAERAELLKQADAIGGDLPGNGPGTNDDPNYDNGIRAREIARVAGITSSFNVRSLDNTSQDEAKRLRKVNEDQLGELKKIAKEAKKPRGLFAIN